MDITIYYATNRAHEGAKRFKPDRYGTGFSSDGMENLRFGRVSFHADTARVSALLDQDRPHTGRGDGEALQDYFSSCVKQSQRIEAYEESIPDAGLSEVGQKKVLLGSKAMFADLQGDMQQGRDMMVLIHGYNVSWEEAVGTAAALEATMNRPDTVASGSSVHIVTPTQAVRVVLFTWPSNGQALPFVSYKSDRGDAAGSSGAIGRGLLKVRDFLHELGREVRTDNIKVKRLRKTLEEQGMRPSEIDRAVAQLEATEVCGRNIHLLAHSMGNFVLQHALDRLWEFTPGTALPRLFDRVFLCAADVDDDVLDIGKAMEQVHQVANVVSIYHNPNDNALRVSDYTKANPDRLGQRGAARPQGLHKKMLQVDCSALVTGLTQHSYYTNGRIARDIRLSLQGLPPEAPARGLNRQAGAPNMWRF
ncbi:alpha/beta hydrolase [Rhodoferax sp. PAMC 29310]|uniref:alpha/beta hydrolase n=1 Tax=Rhodoferax sp. PAMC 29310 TaxID=2822760 RepID=UPI001B328474|nr:alpha/beta hydrolase [Rhodoferax sp. PAMC 29310]